MPRSASNPWCTLPIGHPTRYWQPFRPSLTTSARSSANVAFCVNNANLQIRDRAPRVPGRETKARDDWTSASLMSDDTHDGQGNMPTSREMQPMGQRMTYVTSTQAPAVWAAPAPRAPFVQSGGCVHGHSISSPMLPRLHLPALPAEIPIPLPGVQTSCVGECVGPLRPEWRVRRPQTASAPMLLDCMRMRFLLKCRCPCWACRQVVRASDLQPVANLLPWIPMDMDRTAEMCAVFFDASAM